MIWKWKKSLWCCAETFFLTVEGMEISRVSFWKGWITAQHLLYSIAGAKCSQTCQRVTIVHKSIISASVSDSCALCCTFCAQIGYYFLGCKTKRDESSKRKLSLKYLMSCGIRSQCSSLSYHLLVITGCFVVLPLVVHDRLNCIRE